MNHHDLRLIEIGEKAGAEKATKQIVEWLRHGFKRDFDQLWRDQLTAAIEAGEPFK